MNSTPDRAQRHGNLPVETEPDYPYYYRKWHDESDAHFENMSSAFASKLSPLLNENRAARVLEIGCGMGFALAGLRRLGYTDCVGIDTSRGQIDSALRRGLKAMHVPLSETEQFYAQHVDCFDVVLCIDVLEHLPVAALDRFLAQIYATIRSGGQLVCQVPNANSGIASRMRYVDWTHHSSFTESSLDFVLHEAGFERIQILEANPIIRPRWPMLFRPAVLHWMLRSLFHRVRRLEFALELGSSEARSIPLTPNIIAIAHKRP